jgi:WD40 repeat protein
MTVEKYRVFLSSPADVGTERGRADLIVKKLNAERIDQPQLELVRWELEYYGADSSFQDQIPKPSECQLVVCIFWKRIGSELPDKYVRSDGTIPTGTEYEFEEAMQAAAARPEKLPDVLVYRKTAEVKFSVETLEFEKAQYDRFMAFWQRWFRNEKGHFLAGFQSFSDPDEFEAAFERHLRVWLNDREASVAWTHGSPFRGLEPFGIEHADIFFGRRREVERARARLISSAMGGKPFLLIAGASGAGKSSLVRAGLIPRLSQFGGLSTLASALRWTAVTPGQIAEDWPRGLAAGLFEKEALGDDLRLGDFDTPEKLAAQIARADSSAPAPIVRALKRVGDKLAAAEGRATAPKVALLILIDQLEELFAWPHDKAACFLTLIQELCSLPEQPVWVAATMRSDFQHRLAEFPSLDALAGRTEIKGPYDTERTLVLGLPSAGDLRDMILSPARTAGLTFETKDDRDLAQLIEAEARPEAMPAIQFLLSELYSRRSGKMLTLDAFDALGGVDGVMARRGEDVFHGLDEPAQNAFPRVVRALVTQVRADVPASARRVAEQVFADDSPAGKMIAALREARLIISDRGELRFTHDSILTGWGRLKDQIAEEQRLFGARERLEQYCRRWAEAPQSPARARRKLLLDGFPLAEGCELLGKWGASALADRQPELPAYIAASDALQKRTRRIVQAVGWSVATIFAVFSVLLFNQWQSTLRAQKETEASLLIAQSQSHLRDGKVDLALDKAVRAFKSVPSVASRSALLQALMEVSPHLKAVTALGADTGEALAWTSSDSLDFVTGSGRLRTLDLTKRRSGLVSDGWTLPVIKRRQDGNRSVIRGLSLFGTNRIIAVFDEGSIGVYQRGTSALRLQAPTQEISVNPTAHAVAIGQSGTVSVLATAEEAIIVYRCEWREQVGAPPECQSAALPGARGRAVAISPDEKKIAVGDQSGRVTVYDLAGRPIGDPATFNAPINALGWAQQREWLAVGTIKGEIAVLDTASETKRVVARQTFGDRPVATLAWSPKGIDLNSPDLAFVCNGASICLWRSNADVDAPEPFKPVVRFEGHLNVVTRLSWAPTGVSLASSSADGSIRIWSLAQDIDASFALYSDEVSTISTVSGFTDRQWVAGGSTDGTIHVWDAKTGALDRVFKSSSRSEVNDLAWSRKGTLASIHEDDTVNILSSAARQPAVEITITSRPGGHLTWTDEDGTIAVPMRESGIILLDRESPLGEPVRITSDGKDEAWGVAAIPGGRELLVSYTSGDIKIWDLASRKLAGSMKTLGTANREKIGVGSLSVSPDGRWLATSGGDRFVTVYDIATRTTQHLLATEANETSTVAFSPDGQKLAALGSDNRLYVWTFGRHEPELQFVVGVIPSRATIGDAGQRNETATWLDWVSTDQVAVATRSAAVTVISIEPAKWLKRIDGLASGAEGSVK